MRGALLSDSISTHGQHVDDVFLWLVGITGGVAVLGLGVLVFCLVAFGEREGRGARYSRGSAKLSTACGAAVLACVAAILWIQEDAWTESRELPDRETSFRVRVFAEQYAWHFVYPGPDGRFEPAALRRASAQLNPVGLENPAADTYRPDLVVPVGTPVILELNSLGKYDPQTEAETRGVRHGFSSPELRLKGDVMPGVRREIWFQATETGDYEIVCTELCGLGHSLMTARLRILADTQLDAALGYDWNGPGALPATFETGGEPLGGAGRERASDE